MIGNNSLHITSFCRITERVLVVDDVVVFRNTEELPRAEWLKAIYRYSGVDYPKFHKMDALCKATFLATEYIARKCPLEGTGTPLVFSNYSSSFVADDKHAVGIFDREKPVASPATFVYTLPNIAMGEISIRHQLHSENVFFIFDDFMPEFLTDYVKGVIIDKGAKQVLAGWTEIGKNDSCDILLYLISVAEGDKLYTTSDLEKLYNKHYE